jgi:hypothetical protein
MEGPKWTDMAIVFLTVGIVVVSVLQWHEMHTGSTDTHDLALAAKAQAEASKAQAEAAARAATDTHELALQAKNQADRTKDIADRTLAEAVATNRLAKTSAETLTHTEKSLRPWVNAQKVFPTVDVAEGYVPIAIEVENAGSSPALHTVTYQEVTIICGGDERERFPHNPPYSDYRSWPSTAMLPPGTGGVTDPYGITIDHDRMVDLNMGRCTLYGYGIITYCDAFGYLHWQNYCGRWIQGTSRKFNTC